MIHPRQTCPEPTKALTLPADDRVGSDANQGIAQAIPEQGEPDPEEPVEGSQHGSFPFSLGGGELKTESGVFYRDGRMTAEQESRDTKKEEDKGRQESRFLVYIARKVKLLRANGILANDRKQVV